jgi:hypothetical protein
LAKLFEILAKFVEFIIGKKNPQNPVFFPPQQRTNFVGKQILGG